MQLLKALLIFGASTFVLSTTGCVSQPAVKQSYVSGLNNKSAEIVIPAIVDYVSFKLPPAKSTIYLAPSKYSNLDAVIEDAFKAKGFAISNMPDSEAEVIHQVRYEVSPLVNGLLVNIFIDEQQASTMAVYWQKKWVWLGKYTVRGGSNV